MNITAKHIDRSNVVFSFKEGSIAAPDPAQMFALYSSAAAQGSMFSDHPALATRIFDFPNLGLQWVFEPGRVRLEDKKHRPPAESGLPKEALRVLSALYPKVIPMAHGFNYDILYRVGAVIPTDEIMGAFLKPESIADVRDFGWQYTLAHEKGRKTETYFFKMVSPIEFSVHANFHVNDAGYPSEKELESSFVARYADVDKSLSHMSLE